MSEETNAGHAAGAAAGADESQNEPKEEFKVSGEDLVGKIKKIIQAGNARRIILKNDKGEVMMEIPLTFAVVGTVFAPVLAAVGALAALITECTITVVRK